MGVGAGVSMYVVVVQKFTFAISSPDKFLSYQSRAYYLAFHSRPNGGGECLEPIGISPTRLTSQYNSPSNGILRLMTRR